MKSTLTRLSPVQVKALCSLANKAYKVAKSRHAIDDETTADDYRKAGQKEAAGIESLKDAHQGHYLAIKGKWFVVLGQLEEAFDLFLRAGDQAQHHAQMKWRLIGQIAHLADAIKAAHLEQTQIALSDAEVARQAWAYTNAMARDKSAAKTARLQDLTTRELEQLGFTVTNRANAKLGVGHSSTRNKNQRPARSQAEGVTRMVDNEASLMRALARKLTARA
jgi:hypothetical protein